MWKRIMDPSSRVRFAWFLLVTSLVGWPLTAFTVAKDEPQFILGLSWLAIALTAWDVVNTTDVRKEQENEE
jgi:hypothetical protein